LSVWRSLGELEQSNQALNTISPNLEWPISRQITYAEQLLASQRIDELTAWKSQVESNTPLQQMAPPERKRWKDLRVNAVLVQGVNLESAGQFERALASYYQILGTSYPYENSVRIAILRASMKSGASLKSKQFIIQALYLQRDRLTNDQLESLVPLFNYYGDQDEVKELMLLLSQRQDSSSQSMLSMLDIAMGNQQWELARKFALLTLEKDNLTSSSSATATEVAPLSVEMPLNAMDDELSESDARLKRLYFAANDSWISNGARRHIDTLQERESGHVAVGYQQLSNAGKNATTTIPIEFSIPVMQWDGHLVLRTDYVALKSGDLNYYSSSEETSSVSIDQQQSGWAVGLGYQTESWGADFGTTPIGFDSEELVGGISVNGDIQSVGWGVTLSKRPLTSSMLSYSGLHVPQGNNDTNAASDTPWGSVMKTGVKIDLSYDEGLSDGVWGSAQYHQLTGQSVDDNQRVALLGGYYYKLINEENERFSIGSNAMWLAYRNNQDEYSYGMGGYYSPQSYVSVSFPVNYNRMLGDDVALFSSIGLAHSWSVEDGYVNTNQSTSSSQGFGVNGEIGVERRLNGHWLIGAQVKGQFDSNYSPVTVGLYSRYSFNDSWKKLDLVPHTISAYSDFD
jgi:hypothetical protein